MKKSLINSCFVPNFMVNCITDITLELLKERGIAALVLDVDNTLTVCGSQQVTKDVSCWLCGMKAAGVPMMIVSNNTKKRISPFANKLELPFISMGMKPYTRGFQKACAAFSLKPAQVAIVGDQIFTDILGGNLHGLFTILVLPFAPEKGLSFRIRRRLEKQFISRYKQREERALK